MMNKKYFGEILESSLHSFIGQSWKWDMPPKFGSLVKIESNNRILYAVVHEIQTGSIDESRKAFAYQKTEEDLKREQPQIFEFLKTNFSCLCLGYEESGVLFHQLPPQPPKIHSFVSFVETSEYINFFQNEQYLHVLFGLSNNIINVDELLLAILKNMAENKLLTSEKLANFTSSYSLLTGNDYRRLKLFLQRVGNYANLI